MSRTYEVITGRSGNWWWIEIPEVDNGFSQARRYRQVAAMAREVISLLLDVPQDSFDVAVRIKGEEADLVANIERLEAAVEIAKATADSEKRKAVKVLKAKGLPVRDVAELLHVSPSWVSELSKEHAA